MLVCKSKSFVLLSLLVASAVALPRCHKTEKGNELSASRKITNKSNREEDNDSSASKQSQTQSTANIEEEDKNLSAFMQSLFRTTPNREGHNVLSVLPKRKSMFSYWIEDTIESRKKLSFCKFVINETNSYSRSPILKTNLQICQDRKFG